MFFSPACQKAESCPCFSPSRPSRCMAGIFPSVRGENFLRCTSFFHFRVSSRFFRLPASCRFVVIMQMEHRRERALWLARNILPHEPALRRWLQGSMSVSADVDDVIQEAFARLSSLDSIAGIQNPKAYFFQTAISIMRQEVRRARIVTIEAVTDLDRLEVEASDATPDRHAELRQDLHRVMEAIEALPQRCREAFILRRVHGLSQREIAQKLQISENTVEKHIGRGLRQIMCEFGNGGNTPLPASNHQVTKTEVHARPAYKRRDL